MNNKRLTATVKKLPANLVLTSVLSAGFTIGISLIYLLLCLTYFLFRYDCTTGSTSNGADYFWLTIFRVYILQESCDTRFTIERLTPESTVLILVSVIICVSFLCLVSAITLIAILQDEKNSRYVSWAVYAYIGCCVSSLIIDLTTACFFGVDYSYLSSLLRKLTAGSPSNYKLEVIRQGAFWLMTLALKGYIIHIVNGVFIVLLVIYVIQFEQKRNKNEHSIHKLGAMDGYEQRRNPEEPTWSTADIYNNSIFTRAPQGSSNSGYAEDIPVPRSPMRPDRVRADHISNNSFDRSDSWHHSMNNAYPSTRPFSYLEEAKRNLQPPPPSFQSSAASEPSWRREPWLQPQGPPVPAPDYSPTQPRRLKSALKPSYL